MGVNEYNKRFEQDLWKIIPNRSVPPSNEETYIHKSCKDCEYSGLVPTCTIATEAVEYFDTWEEMEDKFYCQIFKRKG